MWLWLKTLLSGFWGFLKLVGKALLAQGADLLLDIARQSVVALASADLSDSEKRAKAFKSVKEYAMKEGIEARDSAIYTLIEMAYQELKDNLK